MSDGNTAHHAAPMMQCLVTALSAQYSPLESYLTLHNASRMEKKIFVVSLWRSLVPPQLVCAVVVAAILCNTVLIIVHVLVSSFKVVLCIP